ncbi:MAG: peroxide stress protein YaaA [Gammaproteobacteria bacterium]|nr:peroxide stress protein YaaA [Gammaproteobacteria bacterium]
MLVVVSPAKTLDYETPLPSKKSTQPRLLDESEKLVEILRDYSADELGKLMSVSDKIADLNVGRFHDWSQPFSPSNARPAVFAFKGDVYEGLQAYDFKAADLDFAQKHLRILSGLYGVLRPLDLMQPYRLEMGTRLQNPAGKNLYEFWDRRVTDLLNADLKKHANKTLINLASNEYFKSVKKKNLDAQIITPQFRDWKNGQYKMISFFAKKARGMMSRFIISERIDKTEEIKNFAMEGYTFSPKLSSDSEWVFTRKQSG